MKSHFLILFSLLFLSACIGTSSSRQVIGTVSATEDATVICKSPHDEQGCCELTNGETYCIPND